MGSMTNAIYTDNIVLLHISFYRVEVGQGWVALNGALVFIRNQHVANNSVDVDVG